MAECHWRSCEGGRCGVLAAEDMGILAAAAGGDEMNCGDDAVLGNGVRPADMTAGRLVKMPLFCRVALHW